MTDEDVLALIAEGERTRIELKRSLADSRKIIETIAAMATVGGGQVLIGVRDDGTVVGADIGVGERERLVQQILSNTDPKLYVDLEEVRVLGMPVLVIGVPPGDGPHLAFGRAFHRSGAATVAMTRDEYERRLMDRMRESGGFERRSDEDWSQADLDQAAVAWFAERAESVRGTSMGSVAEIPSRLHVIRSGRPTVAALLLFGREPQGPFPQAVVRARDVRGVQLVTDSFEGRLTQQIDRATDFVSSRLRRVVDLTGTVRAERPELPPEAVREVLVNAIAHRDYRSTAPIQLTLTDNGMTVWNAGHLPAPLTPARLRTEHPSVPPNPLIARALFLCGYIEQWGTGTVRVVEEMRRNGNPEAIFEDADTAGGVRVQLPFLGRLPDALTPRQTTLLGRFSAADSFRTADWARAAGVSHRTALDDLRALESMGLVAREGRGRASTWRRT